MFILKFGYRDAKTFCQDNGMKLVVLETVVEMNKLAAADPKKGSSRKFFLISYRLGNKVSAFFHSYVLGGRVRHWAAAGKHFVAGREEIYRRLRQLLDFFTA